METRANRVRSTALALIICCLLPSTSRAGLLFVDADAIGTNDGSSWADAFVDLQSALSAAGPGDEIWVAEGIYHPTSTGDATIAFEIDRPLLLYGGFQGVEVSRDERNPSEHLTVLDGDPLSTRNSQFYSNNVLVVRDVVDGPTIVDGFEIQRSRWSSIVVIDSDQITFTNLAVRWFTTSGPADHAAMARAVDAERRARLETRISGGPSRVRPDPVQYRQFGPGGAFALTSSNAIVLKNILAEQGGGDIVGGVYMDNSHATFDQVTLRDLFSRNPDAGIVGYSESSLIARHLTIADCRATDDSAGITWIGGSIHIMDSAIIRPRALYQSMGRLSSNTEALFERVLFEGGIAEFSNQLRIYDGTAVFRNCVFRGNVTAVSDDPLAPPARAVVGGSGIFTNCLFENNLTTNGTGGALELESGAVVGCTIANNGLSIKTGETAIAVGISAASTVPIVNTIVWNNTIENADTPRQVAGNTLVSNSIVQFSGASGANWDPLVGTDLGGNLDIDPKFATPGIDFTLATDSPAIDAGNSSELGPSDSTDLGGSPRVFGPSVDMGAYEAQESTCDTFVVIFGNSWDSDGLQALLDREYGAGAINAANYEGARCGDADTAYWFDDGVDAWFVREIGRNVETNELGWYIENLTTPTIDGIDDGVIFGGAAIGGATAFIDFGGPTRFGLYLDPNGALDGENAPQPERFYTNRRYNDSGPSGGSGPGDPQALIYDVTALHGGIPTYVIAWEESDAGGLVTPNYAPDGTDNDYNDLVVEIRASSPVRVENIEDSAQTTDPARGRIVSAAPNPFNPQTTIVFDVPRRTHTTLHVFDVKGRLVRTLDAGLVPSGRGEVRWDGRDDRGDLVSSGVYLVRFAGDEFQDTHRITLLK